MTAAPKVFISYSHDSEEQSEYVKQLADKLRVDGIDAELDQYQTQPPQGWPRWCEEQLRPKNSDFVLVICTQNYMNRVEGKIPSDVGSGVFWEGTIIYNYLYSSKSNDRFLLVFLGEYQDEILPPPLQGFDPFVVKNIDLNDRGYEELYRFLTKQPKAKKPSLGSIIDLGEKKNEDKIHVARSLPEKDTRTNFQPIDDDLEKYFGRSRFKT